MDLLAEYGAALEAAAKLQAEAEYHEHHRKVVLAEQMDPYLPEWKADAGARISQPYIEKLNELAEATKAAGLARGKVLHIQARLDVWRTRESTRRAQLQQGER